MFRRRSRVGDEPPQQLHAPSHTGPAAAPAGDGRRDLVIGAASGYAFDELRYWLNSLERTGFAGDRVVIAYDMAVEAVHELNRRGCHVVTFAENRRRDRYVFPRPGFRNEDVSIDRFHQIWRFLAPRREQYRYVIATDVRDVIFQADPADWLSRNLGAMRINVGHEGVLLGDEPWNRDVLLQSYGPALLEALRGREACNAGTIAGDAMTMTDFMLNVFLCSRLNPVPYTDQTALNILLSLEPYRSLTRFNRADDDWACQAATMADPDYLARVGPHVRAAAPVLRDGVVLTADGRPYCLVHQYDRVRGWNEVLWRKYAG